MKVVFALAIVLIEDVVPTVADLLVNRKLLPPLPLAPLLPSPLFTILPFEFELIKVSAVVGITLERIEEGLGFGTLRLEQANVGEGQCHRRKTKQTQL